MKAGFVVAAASRSRYLEAGEGGVPLLLLHGIGLSADIFYRNVDALGGGRRVVAVDLPGHGFSDTIPLDGGSPQRLMARHLLAVAEVLGIGRFAVLGHSFGGLIGALMAVEAPDRVESLIVVASGSTFQGVAEQKKTLRAAAENGSRAMRDVSLDACRKRLANICYSADSVPEEILLSQLTSYAQPDRLAAYLATVEGAIATLDQPSERVYARLETLAVRTLIIAGREDIRAALAMHEEGRRRMPDAELLVFDRCGHLPFMEHPAAFNDTVARFLDPARPAAGPATEAAGTPDRA